MAVPSFTIVGNLAADPDVRQGNNGPWGMLTVITTTRRRNRDTNQWEDGDRASFRCVVYGDLAANIKETLHQGVRVIATGRLRDRQYTDNQGQTRYTTEFVIDEIGPSLRFATAQVTRNPRGGQGGYQGGGYNGGGQGGYSGGNSGYQGGNGGYNGGYSGGANYQSAPAQTPQQSAPAQQATQPTTPAAAPESVWGDSSNSGGFGAYGSSSDFGGNSEFGGEGDDPAF